MPYIACTLGGFLRLQWPTVHGRGDGVGEMFCFLVWRVIGLFLASTSTGGSTEALSLLICWSVHQSFTALSSGETQSLHSFIPLSDGMVIASQLRAFSIVSL